MIFQTIIAFLEMTIFENAFIVLDIWSILHFLLFFFIAKLRLLPFRLALIGMILFEIFEFIMARFTPFFQEGFKDTFTDLLVNIAGFIIGSLV